MNDPALLIAEAQALTEHLAVLQSRWECPLPGCDGLPHEGWVHRHARAAQREPDEFALWLLMAGRGFGKTKTGAETTKKWAGEKRRHLAVIARTDREVRNICLEGPAGLLSVIPPEDVADYQRSPGNSRLLLANGTIIRAFTCETPDALRGYAFDAAWCDEYGAWSPQVAQATMDNLWFSLREAVEPKVVVTTTPRRVTHVKRLLEEAETDRMLVVTRGRTEENLPNLSPVAVERLYRQYGGTHLGRQELDGELIDDVEGALWTLAMIDATRVAEVPDLFRTVVAVDPAVTNHEDSDETGIVVIGAGGDPVWPDLYVLDDLSGRYSPDGWARVVVGAVESWGADCVVAEVNQGGDMVESVLRQQDRLTPYHGVHATKGKYVRAEPVASLWEQERGHVVGSLPALEDQMSTFVPGGKGGSPDRMDAMVWGATDLMRNGPAMLGNPLAQRRLNRTIGGPYRRRG